MQGKGGKEGAGRGQGLLQAGHPRAWSPPGPQPLSLSLSGAGVPHSPAAQSPTLTEELGGLGHVPWKRSGCTFPEMF